MGSLWAPFGCPSWLKFALGTLPEGVRKRIIFKNVVFAPVLRFLLRKPYLGGQDGAQKGPRWDQDGSKTVLAAVFSVFVFDFVFGTILDQFWLPKPLPLGTLFDTKLDQKNDQNFISKKDGPKSGPRRPQEAPKTPPGGPGTPQEVSRAPKMTPQELQNDPPGGQNDPPSGQQVFPKHLVQQPFRKDQRSRKSRKKSKKKSTMVIHGGHSHRSSQKLKALSQRSEPKGWRRWSREALFNKKSRP